MDRVWGGGSDYTRKKEDIMDGDNHRNREHQATVEPEDPAEPSREAMVSRGQN